MRKVPTWDDYFLSLLPAIASRSKDPDSQVGCLIVDDNQTIIGVGYNGFPPKYRETPDMWVRPEKYIHVVHAEMNAIFNCTKDIKSIHATMYVSFYPCKECAKNILAAGINRLVVSSPYYKDEINTKIFSYGNLEVVEAL